MTLRFAAVPLLAALVPAVACNATLARGLDGITIIELHTAAAGNAIVGHAQGPNRRYLVMFISPKGTYASVRPWRKGIRACIAWAQSNSYDGKSIVFGVPATEKSMNLKAPPSVCQPFKVTLHGGGSVQIEARTKFDGAKGPLHESAQPVHYSGRHRIAAYVPFTELNWDASEFERYAVKGVPLGPIDKLRKRLPAHATLKINGMITTQSGKRRGLTVTIQRPDDPNGPRTVTGRMVLSKIVGWPRDVVFETFYSERLPQTSLVKAFASAVVERYGRPSFRTPAQHGRKTEYYWVFDLVGKQVQGRRRAPGNCMSTQHEWVGSPYMAAPDGDLGPWGCALVVRLSHDNFKGVVRKYDTVAVSGYVGAINHFTARLTEIKYRRRLFNSSQ